MNDDGNRGSGSVVDRLSALWNRPTDDRARRVVVFVAIAVVLSAVAAVLVLTRPDGSSSTPVATGPSTTSTRLPAAPSSDVTTLSEAVPGSPEATAPYRPPATAERAVRTFLAGYLRYLYGQGRAGSIERAAPLLVRRLAADPPRVSPAQMARKPRVVEVRARKPRTGRLRVLAMIEDGGVSRYPIGAVMAVRGGVWQVIELANDE